MESMYELTESLHSQFSNDYILREKMQIQEQGRCSLLHHRFDLQTHGSYVAPQILVYKIMWIWRHD